MRVHQLQLEKRPEGGAVISADTNEPIPSDLGRGWKVTLRYQDVNIVAQIMSVEQDRFFLGQVIVLDGYIDPAFERVLVGSYLRFREEHVFTCHK